MTNKSKKERDFSVFLSPQNIHYEKLKSLYEELKGYIETVEKSKENIPVCVFSSKISCLETIVKYLKENLKLSFKDMGSVLGRSAKTLWQAYKSANIKHPGPLNVDNISVTIPIMLFRDRKLSILEHIILYLKNQGMRFSEIARKLERDPRTIWTAYSRAVKKNVK